MIPVLFVNFNEVFVNTINANGMHESICKSYLSIFHVLSILNYALSSFLIFNITQYTLRQFLLQVGIASNATKIKRTVFNL